MTRAWEHLPGRGTEGEVRDRRPGLPVRPPGLSPSVALPESHTAFSARLVHAQAAVTWELVTTALLPRASCSALQLVHRQITLAARLPPRSSPPGGR